MNDSAVNLAIVGAGAVGRALAKAFHESGVAVQAVISRTASDAADLADAVDAPDHGTDVRELPEGVDILFLCVPDDEIRTVDAAIVGGASSIPRLIGHTSGARDSHDLERISRRGCAVFSFHPLQTFTVESAPGVLTDIWITVEGDHNAVEVAAALASRIGAKPLRLNREQKRALHAAAVFASNYLVTLQSAAVEIGTASGLEGATVRGLLAPLIETTARNVALMEPGEAISGPIARGDLETVQLHLELLRKLHPELAALYATLGRETTKLARRGGRISEDQALRMLRILQ